MGKMEMGEVERYREVFILSYILVLEKIRGL